MPGFKWARDSTPIDDVSGLIPGHIRTKNELDEWEAENILSAVKKHLKPRHKAVFNTAFLNGLHMDMFGDTWKWAGQYRKKELNIGTGFTGIPVEIRKLLDDMAYWKEKGVFGALESSVRIHHRLAWIHPYLNGNGRHARLAADIYLHNEGHKMPAWPDRGLVENSDIRKRYIAGLKAADHGDYSALIRFTKRLLK